MNHVIKIRNRHITVDNPSLFKGNRNTDTITLDTDEEWNGKTITVYVGNDGHVEERVGKLEAGGVEPGELEEPVDEWPEWVQPTSKDTQYRKGDKVTFNGRHYTCVKNNVSSSPDEDSKSWQLVE